MAYKPYHGRCCICDATEHRSRPVKGFCFVHEPYLGASADMLAVARSRYLLELQRDEVDARRDRDDVRRKEGNRSTAEQLEWML